MDKTTLGYKSLTRNQFFEVGVCTLSGAEISAWYFVDFSQETPTKRACSFGDALRIIDESVELHQKEIDKKINRVQTLLTGKTH